MHVILTCVAWDIFACIKLNVTNSFLNKIVKKKLRMLCPDSSLLTWHSHWTISLSDWVKVIRYRSFSVLSGQDISIMKIDKDSFNAVLKEQCAFWNVHIKIVWQISYKIAHCSFLSNCLYIDRSIQAKRITWFQGISNICPNIWHVQSSNSHYQIIVKAKMFLRNINNSL